MSQFARGPGSLRPSQIVSTFGPGSICDNTKDSFLVMGTDRWKTQNCKTLNDETLLTYLKKNDDRRYSRLQKFLVPISSDEDSVQIPVRTFPAWGVCPVCHKLQNRNSAHGDQGIKCQYSQCTGRGTGRQNDPETVPVRFIAACKNGHLEDFPWYRWVHRGQVNDCSESEADLFLIDNLEHSSLESKNVICKNCNRKENMGPSLSSKGLRSVIPEGCHGRRPWLSTDDPNPCQNSQGEREYLMGLYKGGSNVYFSKSVRAVTVPPFAGPLADRVINYMNDSIIAEQSEETIRKNLLPVLFPNDDPGEIIQIMNAVTAKRQSESVPDILHDEFVELNRKKFGQDGIDLDDFKTEPIELPDNFDHFENLVLVRKMREVIAQTGFYRIEPFGTDEDDQRKQSPVTNYPEELPEWLPAVENRGEGIFFSLRESKINEWIYNNCSVSERFQNIARHNHTSSFSEDIQSSIKYILLHSLSHILIKEISNFAGYSASSIRERIYSGENMSGILIYTSSPSSDGSLGGLVEQGKTSRFNIVLQRALRKASVCSMDPLCSHSHPGIGNSKNGSACHACIFLPETSCECMNNFLDRAFVHATLSEDVGFFGT